MTKLGRVAYSPAMRLSRVLLIGPLALLGACAEQPTCVDFDDDGEYTIDCSAGKVAVCGDDPAAIYNDGTGALLPVDERSEDGSCGDDLAGDCRPRPVCNSDGEAVCPNGETPLCRLGEVTAVDIPAPAPTDSGPPPTPDGGGGDAGPGDDAGPPEDAGPSDDAGAPEDAGITDAGD